jgi:hypothetical protein
MPKILAVVTLAAACGGANWTGAWSGGLSLGGTCSDGSSGSSTENATWNLTEENGLLTITPNGGTCAQFQAEDEGTSARFEQKTCPPSNGSTATFGPGTLTLETSNTLLVDLNFMGVTSTNITCNGTASGSMIRQ